MTKIFTSLFSCKFDPFDSNWQLIYNAKYIVYCGKKLPVNFNTLRLVGLTFTADVKWNEYIESISRYAAVKVFSLCRLDKFSRQNLP